MLVHLFSTPFSWTRRTKDQRAFSLEPQGMSQASLSLLSFCFPLRFSLSHLALWVLTLSLWSSAPGMPSHTFPLKFIWLKPSPLRGSYSFSLCSNVVFSCFSSLKNGGIHTVRNLSRIQYFLQISNILCRASSHRALLFIICCLWTSQTRGQRPATTRLSHLMIFRSMCGCRFQSEVPWQPSWFRGRWRRHLQLWGDAALAAPASHTPPLSSIVSHRQRERYRANTDIPTDNYGYVYCF